MQPQNYPNIKGVPSKNKQISRFNAKMGYKNKFYFTM